MRIAVYRENLILFWRPRQQPPQRHAHVTTQKSCQERNERNNNTLTQWFLTGGTSNVNKG